MLLTKTELEAIKSGKLSLVFRCWRRPSVKTGGSLKTAVGVLRIEGVVKIERSQITERDAAKARYGSLSQLLNRLDSRKGEIYRIEIRFAGADPCIQLRENDRLSKAAFREVQAKLARLDSASRVGDWTRTVLRALHQHPHVAAAKLAGHTGFEKEWLKHNIRKLKNLGLTISGEAGYELSRRGRTVLNHLADDI